SLLSSSIKYIHLNGNDSNSYDLIHQYFYYNNDKESFCFPNLESLNITQCLLSKSLIDKLSLLIQYQLTELKLIIDEDAFQSFTYEEDYSSISCKRENVMVMLEKFLCKIFSGQSQLISLHLDISEASSSIHQCLKSRSSTFSSNNIVDLFHSNCLTLRYLHIHSQFPCFFEHLIEHVPNLEQLTICFQHLRINFAESYSNIQKLVTSNASWSNKVPKLKCFIFKSHIFNDLEFMYLKWLLNNVNHIRKLEIYLKSGEIFRADQSIWKSVIDANFVRQYCLPDKIVNLVDFDFYICSKRQLAVVDIENVVTSFKINSFFIKHQWTNVSCFYDEDESCQYIFSSTKYKFRTFHTLWQDII
ncbi:unnamed protein product, partial [Rotaria magnacalcarata]